MTLAGTSAITELWAKCKAWFATASHTHTESDITDLGSYLPTSGGTLTGDLELDDCDVDVEGGFAMLWHPEIVRGTAPSSDIYGGGGALKLVDKNGVQIGFVQPVQYADGTEAMQLGVGNSDSSDWNTLAIGYDGNGNKYVNISGRSEWRNALGASSGVWPVSVGGTGAATAAANTVFAAPNGSAGAATFRKLVADDVTGLGHRVSKDQSSNVKCTTATWTAIASVELEAGTWMLFGNLDFASNATGRRYACISNSTPTSAQQRQRAMNCNAVNGAQTLINTAISLQPTATTTYSVYAYQTSGGDLNCTGFISAVRIA